MQLDAINMGGVHIRRIYEDTYLIVYTRLHLMVKCFPVALDELKKINSADFTYMKEV